MRRLVLFIVATVFIFCLPVAVCARMVSVASEKANMRTGPGNNYRVKWELGRGYPLKVVAAKGTWLKVRDFENDEGWLYAALTGSQPHFVVRKKIVNIRNGPGSKHKVIGKAAYGTVFRTVRSGKKWVQVKHESGLTGWINRKLLWGW